jgi:hypothetical protein
MLRREFLKLAVVLPFAAPAVATSSEEPQTDAETSVRLWLRSVEGRQGVSSVVGDKATCEATGWLYDEVCWLSNGTHFRWGGERPPQMRDGLKAMFDYPVVVRYPTPEMAWTQWKLAFEKYIKYRRSKIHWRVRPELVPPPSGRDVDRGWAVYSRVSIEL